MASFGAAKAQLGGFRRVVRAVVRAIVLLALAAGAGVGLLGLLLARNGFAAGDLVVVAVLLVPPAIVLLFAGAIRALVRLPERLAAVPGRGAEQVDELARIAERARTATWRQTPSLLWRGRGLLLATRDLVRVGLPLRLLAPGFLWLTLVSVVVCVVLVGVGLVAFLVLAVS